MSVGHKIWTVFSKTILYKENNPEYFKLCWIFLCCELIPANEMITDEDRLLCALFDSERK